MAKTSPSVTQEQLVKLRNRLAQVTSSWTFDDYRTFITFYSRILPDFMQAERCTIFIMQRGSNRICSMFGTGLEEEQIEPPLEGSIVGQVIKSGRGIVENNLAEHRGFHSSSDEQTGFVSRNVVCCPIRSVTGESVTGAIQLLNKKDGRDFTVDDLHKLDEISHFLSISIESVMLNQEILTIASRFGKEVERLEQATIHGTKIIAESQAMIDVLNLVRIISKTPVNVLILGENGTGKELVARMIHALGDRADKPFVPVNCACIPENLVESEFFGHEKGAFTGAEQSRRGFFEEASGGTMFLDEIGEMPLIIQPKFLRVIQEGEGHRLGSNKVISYDLRLVSASNRDLAAEIKKERFREDLFFRLFSVEIVIPPLRDRKEDILPLAQHFLSVTNERFSKHVSGFSPEVIDLFERFSWPGNVRQLLKEVERLVALTDNGQIIQPDRCSRDLLHFFNSHKKRRRETDFNDLAIPAQARRLEVGLIKQALERTNGNKTQAAALLDITRQGLLKKLKRYHI
ncbi:sigma-54-dependent Fis family transcriptional regulator [Desulfofustis glycolicus]|uniref:Nif-specific regulatory protein n=1 Tax=Desulfofustis glycolicus DSM 9705 TaxID=1121409 RepID=A0A1M5XE41_9BACT|nr:sigma-54-dependent Fis family transcriptional regulator [Desulfofustis glycolicus]MCB2217930.1 sigma-54-dependent Fis family transcriptional regulator [Desulfobulbaceae bacterium]SHH97808.1 Nif-specific regulatory protein [Desulfofustis glycolicus DSM 9705]